MTKRSAGVINKKNLQACHIVEFMNGLQQTALDLFINNKKNNDNKPLRCGERKNTLQKRHLFMNGETRLVKMLF